MKIDGRAMARKIYVKLKKDVEVLHAKGIQPQLVVILVGNDAGSKAYIRQKINRGTEIGVLVILKRFPRHTSEKTLLAFVEKQNADPSVHGIIIQRPLPIQISSERLKSAVVPEKDVDGFHPESTFEPPLALAIMHILQEIYTKQNGSHLDSSIPFKQWLSNKTIAFVGRGEAGGRPVISHVEKLGIPYSIVHSQTAHPRDILQTADIIISAVGKKAIITSTMLKKGVILIGIGLHKGEDGKLHGDYEEEEIKDIASYYTPTPGGVGPLNVAMLLSNLIQSTAIPNTT